MTAKREAELETENRMLREQVASLEKIIERMQPVIYRPDGIYLAGAAAPQPAWYWWPNGTWTTDFTVTCGSGTLTGTPPEGSTAVLS
jgi:hypothetical protein